MQSNVFVVGNTVLDNLLPYKNDCEYTNKVLITMHRRENHNNLNMWFNELNSIASENKHLEFILPLHPNPNVQKHKHLLTNINVVEPMSHKELIKLLVKCRIVITDSGGLQEECSFFNKKCLVCRETTERPEAVGVSSFIVSSPEKLKIIFNQHILDYMLNCKSPYGDGYASKKIASILLGEKNV